MITTTLADGSRVTVSTIDWTRNGLQSVQIGSIRGYVDVYGNLVDGSGRALGNTGGQLRAGGTPDNAVAVATTTSGGGFSVFTLPVGVIGALIAGTFLTFTDTGTNDSRGYRVLTVQGLGTRYYDGFGVVDASGTRVGNLVYASTTGTTTAAACPTIAENTLVRAGSGPRWREVYLWRAAALHLVPDPETLRANGWTFDQVATYPEGCLFSLPLGAAVSAPVAACVAPAAGTLVRADGQRPVYLVLAGVRHHVPSPAIATANALDLTRVEILDAACIDAIPLGTPVQMPVVAGGSPVADDEGDPPVIGSPIVPPVGGTTTAQPPSWLAAVNAFVQANPAVVVAVGLIFAGPSLLGGGRRR